jgi:hypothetical protein
MTPSGLSGWCSLIIVAPLRLGWRDHSLPGRGGQGRHWKKRMKTTICLIMGLDQKLDFLSLGR